MEAPLGSKVTGPPLPVVVAVPLTTRPETVVGGLSAGQTLVSVFPGQGKQRWADGRIAELERKIGQQALEIDFLKGRSNIGAINPAWPAAGRPDRRYSAGLA